MLEVSIRCAAEQAVRLRRWYSEVRSTMIAVLGYHIPSSGASPRPQQYDGLAPRGLERDTLISTISYSEVINHRQTR